MATTTQNLALIKPAGTDKIRIAQINSNMDTIDAKMGAVGSTPLQTQATNAAASISALQSGMAIICNGNTHAAIALDQYAYVRNHSSLSEGLYQATATITANATLSASNLSAVQNGGLNGIMQGFEVKTALGTDAFSAANGSISNNYSFLIKRCGVVYFQLYATPNTSGSIVNVASFKLNEYLPLQRNILFHCFDETDKTVAECYINPNNGNVYIYSAIANHGYVLSTAYVSSL